MQTIVLSAIQSSGGAPCALLPYIYITRHISNTLYTADIYTTITSTSTEDLQVITMNSTEQTLTTLVHSTTDVQNTVGESCGTWTDVYHLAPCFAVLGMLGNSVAITVLLRQRFRQLSTMVYLLSLAISDMCFLLYTCLNYVFDVMDVSPFDGFWGCRVDRFLDLTLNSLSNWLIVLVTLERLLYACLSLQHSARWCTQRNAIILISGTIMLTFLWNGGIIAILRDECLVEISILLELSLLIFIVTNVLPCLIVIISSIFLIYKLLCNGSSSLWRVPQGASIRLTGLIVADIANFLLLKFPLQVFSLIIITPNYPHLIFLSPCVHTVLFVLTILSHSLHPYLYVLSGTIYRQELRTLLGCALGGCDGSRRTWITRLSSVTLDHTHVSTEL